MSRVCFGEAGLIRRVLSFTSLDPQATELGIPPTKPSAGLCSGVKFGTAVIEIRNNRSLDMC